MSIAHGFISSTRGVGSPISLFPPVSLNEIVLFTENLLSAFNTNMNDKNNVL